MLKGANIAVTTIGDTTHVVLHETTIVRFNERKVVLDSGGHRTATTKRWMNKAAEEYNLLYQVESKNGNWIVRTPEQERLFSDGIEIGTTPPEKANKSEELKVMFGRVAYIHNVGDSMLDLISKNVNYNAKNCRVYVDWCEIISWSEEYNENCNAQTPDDHKKLAEFIRNVEQSIKGAVEEVCFLR